MTNKVKKQLKKEYTDSLIIIFVGYLSKNTVLSNKIRLITN